MFLKKLFFLFILVFLFSCNSDKTEEEMAELWSKANTKQEIINRSGTKLNSGVDMDAALRDGK